MDKDSHLLWEAYDSVLGEQEAPPVITGSSEELSIPPRPEDVIPKRTQWRLNKLERKYAKTASNLTNSRRHILREIEKIRKGYSQNILDKHGPNVWPQPKKLDSKFDRPGAEPEPEPIPTPDPNEPPLDTSPPPGPRKEPSADDDFGGYPDIPSPWKPPSNMPPPPGEPGPDPGWGPGYPDIPPPWRQPPGPMPPPPGGDWPYPIHPVPPGGDKPWPRPKPWDGDPGKWIPAGPGFPPGSPRKLPPAGKGFPGYREQPHRGFPEPFTPGPGKEYKGFPEPFTPGPSRLYDVKGGIPGWKIPGGPIPRVIPKLPQSADA